MLKNKLCLQQIPILNNRCRTGDNCRNPMDQGMTEVLIALLQDCGMISHIRLLDFQKQRMEVVDNLY